MEVRILQVFHDKADYRKVYLVGETVSFDDARAEFLIGLGLVEPAEEEVEASDEDATEEVKKTASRRRGSAKNNQ